MEASLYIGGKTIEYHENNTFGEKCLSHRAIFTDYFVDLVEEYLGDMIESIVYKYYSDKIDLEIEYESLLSFIVDQLVGDNRDYYEDIDRFRDFLKKLGRRKSISKLVISYLISRYIEGSEEDE